jgi:hypothetical protein
MRIKNGRRQENMMGGISEKLFWNEYVDGAVNEEVKAELEAVKKFVEENGLEGMGGFKYQEEWVHQIDALCPLINGFSLRAWGDFMAALMNTKVNKREYSYTNFAWYAKGE